MVYLNVFLAKKIIVLEIFCNVLSKILCNYYLLKGRDMIEKFQLLVLPKGHYEESYLEHFITWESPWLMPGKLPWYIQRGKSPRWAQELHENKFNHGTRKLPASMNLADCSGAGVSLCLCCVPFHCSMSKKSNSIHTDDSAELFCFYIYLYFIANIDLRRGERKRERSSVC